MKVFSFIAALCFLCGCSPDHKHSEACSHGASKEKDAHEHSTSCTHAEEKIKSLKQIQESRSSASCTHAAEKPEQGDDHRHSAACASETGAKESAEEHHHDESAESKEPKWVSVGEESQKLLGMTFAKTELYALQGLVRLQGRLVSAPSSETVFALPVAGTVRLLVLPGAEVKSGSPLFAVDAPELGQLAVRSAKLEADAARVANELAALVRRLEVYRQSGTRNAELETAKAAKEAERRSVELEREMFKAEEAVIVRMGTVSGSRLTVAAPADGTVRLERTSDGVWCEKGTAILGLRTGRALICETRATALQAEGLSNGMPVTLSRSGVEPIRGLSLVRGGTFDESTLTCALYAAVSNPPAWCRPGLPVTMEIQTSAGEAHTVIPANAWFMENGKSVVFVRHPQDSSKFARREVEVHATTDGRSSVCGVAEGETVVLEGAYELRYQFPVGAAAENAKKAGHFHADGVYHEKEHK